MVSIKNQIQHARFQKHGMSHSQKEDYHVQKKANLISDIIYS